MKITPWHWIAVDLRERVATAISHQFSLAGFAGLPGQVKCSMHQRAVRHRNGYLPSDWESSDAEERRDHLNDERMVVGLRQARDGDAADDANVGDTDRERAAVRSEQPRLDA
jgi:phage replication-related protein YjqB (UPF0714/DUF867 family)